MRQILLFLLLISSLYSRDAFYIGTSYGYYQENFSTIKATNSAGISKIKVGYGSIKSYAIEFSLDYLQNSSKVFTSATNIATDGDKIGFNIGLIKAFDFDISLYPFVRVGFGTGFFDIKRELQSSLSYGSFNLCTGAFIPISKSIDLEFGYEYRRISYQSIDTIKTKYRVSSNANIAYLGLNIRF